jgi:hypothetical protein
MYAYGMWLETEAVVRWESTAGAGKIEGVRVSQSLL